MEVTVRRPRQPSTGVYLATLVTAVVCFLAGLGSGYVLWGSPAPEDSITGPLATEDTPPSQPAGSEAVRAVAEQPADPGTQHLESLEEVWPARHLFIAVEGNTLNDETRAMLAELKPGGVVLLANNIQSSPQTVDLVKAIKTAVGLGDGIADLPLIAADQEGGSVNRLNLTDAPSAEEVAKRGSLEFSKEVGLSYAQAAAKRGVGVIFAPVLDIFEDGGAPSIQPRTFGRDEFTVTALGLWFASGLMDGGTLPVVKHYPGQGGLRADSHRSLPTLNKDVKQLAATMYPFAEAASLAIPGILVGHIAVPAIDKSEPTRPASLSPTMVNTVLREKWGYNGVVITDDITSPAVTQTWSLPDAAVEALASGCDAVIVTDPSPRTIHAICQQIEDAVESGALARKALQDSKKRLDNWQAWLRNPQPMGPGLPEAMPGATTLGTPPPMVEVEMTPTEPQTPQPTEFTEEIYVVQSGDVISKIAARFEGVTSRDIMEWNGLPNANIRIGQELIIRVPGASTAPPALEEVETAPDTETVEPQPVVPEPAPETVEPDVTEATEATPADVTPAEESPEPEQPTPAPAEEVPTVVESKPIEYVVQSGDVLSRIASKFDVTTQQIMEWNNKSNTNIRVQDKLIIHPGPGATVEAAPATPAPAVTDAETEITVTPEPEVEAEPESEPEAPPIEPEPEAPEPEPAPADPSAETMYSVQIGDTLSAISAKYGVSIDDLIEWNDLDQDGKLQAGKVLRILAPEPESDSEPGDEAEAEFDTYVIVSGDSPASIAQKFDMAPAELMRVNGIEDPRTLRVGDTLRVPKQ